MRCLVKTSSRDSVNNTVAPLRAIRNHNPTQPCNVPAEAAPTASAMLIVRGAASRLLSLTALTFPEVMALGSQDPRVLAD